MIAAATRTRTPLDARWQAGRRAGPGFPLLSGPVLMPATFFAAGLPRSPRAFAS